MIKFVPNLQMMACVQIAIPIINLPEIQYLVDCYSPGYQLPENIKICSLIENTTTQQILSLGLATPQEKMVKDCVMNMFSQITECKKTYSLILTACSNHVNKHFNFFWNADGTINQKKTVKSLIENNDLNVKERFLLATKFCLVDDALRLWKSMTETQKCFTPLEIECQPLVKLWIEMYEDRPPSLKITSKVLESSVLQKNVCILRYATQMLTVERQRTYLLQIALKGEIGVDVRAFCLSQLDKCDQELVFRKLTTKVLQCVLTWPYQCVLKNMTGYLWTYLTKEGFCDVLWLILIKIMHCEWSDFRLIEILKEFWFDSPGQFKEHAKQQCIFGPLMIALKCEMQSFPRYEISEACIQNYDKISSSNLCFILLEC